MKNFVISIILLFLLFLMIASTASATIMPPEGVNKEGDSLFFGAKDQSYCYIEGLEYVDDGDEPIEWLVLDQDGSKLLLVSKYAIDYQQYDRERKDYTWKNSYIRSWLNGPFLNGTFTPEEQEAILTVDIRTGPENIEKGWPSLPVENTQDKIFLLSRIEVNKYLPDDKAPLCEFVEYNGGTIFASDNTWWLRSSGKNKDEACFIGNGKNESGWLTDWRCIRPAMWIDTSLFDWDNSRFAMAKKADELNMAKKYDEAIAIVDTLGSYWESAIWSTYYRFNSALDAAENGNYVDAINRIIDTRDFINNHFSTNNDFFGENEIATCQYYFMTSELLVEYKYQLAIQTEESGDIPKAIEMFTEVGQYKDSMDHLRACFDHKNIKYYWLTKKFAERNAGLDKQFAEDNPIKDDDPHSNWSLGRFMISGFTDIKIEDGIPVFFKTPGDNLILWFDLTQDIDALNGNTSLTINKDTNGRDKQFNVNKEMEFGRGALLVKLTNMIEDDKVDMYTDYLAAENGTGANTRIEINEEGTYDIALDYEIKKDELIDKFYNYKIGCSFKVRNGSGMFFIFDLASGSELEDYARAVEGFRISLANSNSLRINFTRYSLNQDETHLDARQTGLASDKDRFDKVGYYEITVTNKETGLSLTKHIFVGSSADLEKYASVDEFLLKFKR